MRSEDPWNEILRRVSAMAASEVSPAEARRLTLDDVVQAVLLKLLKRSSGQDPVEWLEPRAGARLYTFVRHTVQELRRASRRVGAHAQQLVERVPMPGTDHVPGAQEGTSSSPPATDEIAVRRARLTAKQRAVLHRIEAGESLSEIAAAEGRRMEALRHLVLRAVARARGAPRTIAALPAPSFVPFTGRRAVWNRALDLEAVGMSLQAMPADLHRSVRAVEQLLRRAHRALHDP
jgi:hypothetical protein